MFAQPQDLRAHPWSWIVRAILALDRELRKRQGIYEYTQHTSCLFRTERWRADQTLYLDDGTRICRGDPILKLHLWNEHIPHMRRDGASVGWARRTTRAMEISLRELARHLNERSQLHFAAICADMRLGSATESQRLSRIVARYGFETHPNTDQRPSFFHRFGEIILMCLLVLATNPVALRGSTLRRDYVRIYLSRAALERRYGASSIAGIVRRGTQPEPASEATADDSWQANRLPESALQGAAVLRAVLERGNALQ
jgi:hypothetical protein